LIEQSAFFCGLVSDRMGLETTTPPPWIFVGRKTARKVFLLLMRRLLGRKDNGSQFPSAPSQK
jgi:hypothetical protein